MDPPKLTHTLNSSATASSGSGKKRKRPGPDDATEERDNSTNTSSRQSSQQSTAFSAGTRRKVLEWDGGKCWFCGAMPAQIAHVIGQKDNGFKDLVANRLLCFQNIAHQDNAIPLCPTCHFNIDDLNQLGLIFLPTKIEYFIEYEKNDQKRRRETLRIQREGRSSYVGRYGVPSPEEYQNNAGGLYTRYYLRRCFPEAMVASVGQFGEPKHWHGSPSAALRRAQLLLGNTVVKGLPKDVRRKLNELANLYLDLDLETDLEQDYDPGVEAAGSPASDGSGNMATGRRTPSTSRPGRKSMSDGKSGGGDSGGFDKEKGPSESYGEKDNCAVAVFGVDEGDSGEGACGTAKVDLDGSHNSSPTITSHPSLIASLTSSQIDTQSHNLDPSSEQAWTWGPATTGQMVIEFISAKDAIRFEEASGNTEPLIVDADLEEKRD